MNLTITINWTDETTTDSGHPMGVTNEGFEIIFEALSPYGEDISIEQGR